MNEKTIAQFEKLFVFSMLTLILSLAFVGVIILLEYFRFVENVPSLIKEVLGVIFIVSFCLMGLFSDINLCSDEADEKDIRKEFNFGLILLIPLVLIIIIALIPWNNNLYTDALMKIMIIPVPLCLVIGRFLPKYCRYNRNQRRDNV